MLWTSWLCQPALTCQIGSLQVFSSFLCLPVHLYLVLLPMLEKWHFKFTNESRKKPVQDLKLFILFLSIYNFLGHQHSFSMLLAVLRYHKIELCKNRNRREFMLCYQRTALLPAAMKWSHEEQVRYDDVEGSRRLEWRHLRKKKDAKQLLPFITNLNICCFQHCECSFSLYLWNCWWGGDSIYSREGCLLQ